MECQLSFWIGQINHWQLLFFATSGHNDKDGELFLMDAYQLAKDQTIKDKKGSTYQGIAT